MIAARAVRRHWGGGGGGAPVCGILSGDAHSDRVPMRPIEQVGALLRRMLGVKEEL